MLLRNADHQQRCGWACGAGMCLELIERRHGLNGLERPARELADPKIVVVGGLNLDPCSVAGNRSARDRPPERTFLMTLFGCI